MRDEGVRMREEFRINFRTHFSTLDGYRAIAVLLVFCAHYGGGLHQGVALRSLYYFTSFGPAGVGMFFVLSGFLITGILYDTRFDPHFFRTFYARRALRIFPVAYLVMFGCLILTPVLKYNAQWAQLSFLFYAGNIFAHWNGSLWGLSSRTHPALSVNLAHFWSLFVEEQFYLIWPVAVYFIKDRAKLIKIGIAIIIGAFLLRVAFVIMLPFDAAMDAAFRQLPSRADDLAMGGCLALLLRGPSAELWLKRSGTLLAAGLLGIIAVFGLTRHPGFDNRYALTIGMDCVSIASVGLVGTCIQPHTVISKVLSSAPLRRLGVYSYGFYVYHVLFDSSREMFFTWAKIYFRSVAVAGALTAAIYFVGTLILAALSYELYEKRFLNLKRFFRYESKKEMGAVRNADRSAAILVNER
jgi:peptidoglycan/LPS O-acetylase OafA/YrhL